MARIKPFTGYRPTADRAREIASPPYDVIDSDEARALAEGNPASFLHVIKPEIDLPPETDPHAPIVYETARANLDRLLADGLLIADDGPSLYAYRQIMGAHAQVGLVCCIAVDDYDEGAIRLHEKTLPAKENDRTRHMDAIGAHPGPIFLTYRAQSAIDETIARVTAGAPDADVTAEDGVRHTVWRIADKDAIDGLVRSLAAIDCTYVADGHHRAKSASRVRALRRDANPNHTGDEEYNWTLSVLFPHDQLQILAYNRIVADLRGLSPSEFVDRVQGAFDMTETSEPAPDTPRRFGMYVGGRWFRLTPRGAVDESDPVAALDVTILQERLLSPVLGIGDPRTDSRIAFVGGIRGTGELSRKVDSGAWAAAFALYPTTVEQVMSIADAGRIMPPKSTWFEPKLRSGLVVHRL